MVVFNTYPPILGGVNTPDSKNEHPLVTGVSIPDSKTNKPTFYKGSILRIGGVSINRNWGVSTAGLYIVRKQAHKQETFSGRTVATPHLPYWCQTHCRSLGKRYQIWKNASPQKECNWLSHCIVISY